MIRDQWRARAGTVEAVTTLPARGAQAVARVGDRAHSALTYAVALGFLVAWALFATAGTGPIAGDTLAYIDSARLWLSGTATNDQFHGYAAGLLYVPALILDRLTPLGLEQAILVESSLILTIASWFVVPWFSSLATGRKVELVDRAVITGLVFILYGGYAPFATTDFTALVLFMGACGLAWSLRSWSTVLAATLLVGLAYNLRPAYVVAFLALLVFMAVRRSRWVPVIGLGLLLVFVPQSLVNLAQGTSPVPMPYEQAAVGTRTLAIGLRVQRTAATLDPTWPSPNISSCDPARLSTVDLLTPTAYLGVLASDPIASAGLLSRHAVNGLWLDERGPISYSVDGRTQLYGIASFLLIVLMVALAWSGIGRLALRFAALACLPAVFAVVEPRHFMALGVLSIALLLPALRWLIEAPRKTRLTTALLCLVMVGLASGVATSTTAHDVPGVPGVWKDAGLIAPC
jgi:hypothetical protein